MRHGRFQAHPATQPPNKPKDKQMTTLNWSDIVECYAVAGEGHIIDGINPLNGLTVYGNKTEERVKEENPGAERMTMAAFIEQKAARQRTPITWPPSTREQFDEMLNVLPPIDWRGNSFLVGEPHDHMADTGEATYQAYRKVGTHYFTSSRAITRRELAVQLTLPITIGTGQVAG